MSPICWHADAPIILAVGPEQKNVLCLLRGDDAFASPHIGDMENAETFEAWLEAKDRRKKSANHGKRPGGYRTALL